MLMVDGVELDISAAAEPLSQALDDEIGFGPVAS